MGVATLQVPRGASISACTHTYQHATHKDLRNYPRWYVCDTLGGINLSLYSWQSMVISAIALNRSNHPMYQRASKGVCCVAPSDGAAVWIRTRPRCQKHTGCTTLRCMKGWLDWREPTYWGCGALSMVSCVNTLKERYPQRLKYSAKKLICSVEEDVELPDNVNYWAIEYVHVEYAEKPL